MSRGIISSGVEHTISSIWVPCSSCFMTSRQQLCVSPATGGIHGAMEQCDSISQSALPEMVNVCRGEQTILEIEKRMKKREKE